MNSSIENIVEFMKDKCEKDIYIFDNSFIEKTIHYGMQKSSSKNLSEYFNLLKENIDVCEKLTNTFKNSYSEFFRNTNVFALLDQYIIPKIIRKKEKSQSQEIRIWSAGCSSGQEPYSLAILASEYKNKISNNISFRIFATDNSENELEIARQGVYNFNSVKNTKLAYVNKYFSVKNNLYSINKEIKDIVDFSFYDLLDNSFNTPSSSIFGGFDLIICSNVLMYYNQEIQKKILDKLSLALNTNGFCVTSEAETEVMKLNNGFRQLFPPAAIFQKEI